MHDTGAEVTSARPGKGCDVVMKGGITSGVVYPAAIDVVKDEYRLCNVGGTSAGAIAAAAAAAAEYGRERPGGGFDALTALSDELAQDGFIQTLFHPSRPARPYLRLMLSLQRAKKTGDRVRAGLTWAGRMAWVPAVVTALVVAVLLAYGVDRFGGGRERATVLAWIALGVVVAAAVVVAAIAAIVARAVLLALRHLPRNFFGVATGMPERGESGPALTPWLHERIQECAGREGDAPLTFADLETAGVKLQMMTTDLAEARPVRLPLDDPPDDLDGYEGYLYDRAELERLFPRPVVDHMDRVSQPLPGAPAACAHLRVLPGPQMPVIVATRLSLSFPGLLSAVPLWTVRDGHPVKHWLSDGGIGSNFPIHLFDSWLPTRPTFGLNFVPAPRAADVARTDGSTVAATRPRAEVRDSMVAFVRQILDTMQNWRDTLQAELYGFNDRVYDIRLEEGEGGLNLGMGPEVVRRLVDKGRDAGEWAVREFDFDQHKMCRYTLFMHLLQQAVNGVEGQPPNFRIAYSSEEFRQRLADAGLGPPARAQTDQLLDAMKDWGPAGSVDFTIGSLRPPRPVMRVTPDV